MQLEPKKVKTVHYEFKESSLEDVVLKHLQLVILLACIGFIALGNYIFNPKPTDRAYYNSKYANDYELENIVKSLTEELIASKNYNEFIYEKFLEYINKFRKDYSSDSVLDIPIVSQKEQPKIYLSTSEEFLEIVERDDVKDYFSDYFADFYSEQYNPYLLDDSDLKDVSLEFVSELGNRELINSTLYKSLLQAIERSR